MWLLFSLIILTVLFVILIFNTSKESKEGISNEHSEKDLDSVNHSVITPDRSLRTPQSRDRPSSGTYGLSNPSSILRPLEHSPISQYPRAPSSRSRSQRKVNASPIQSEMSPVAALDFVKVLVPDEIVIRAEQSYHYYEKKSFGSDQDYQKQRLNS
jgi:hypothetical protein